jgi:hypothetical protein
MVPRGVNGRKGVKGIGERRDRSKWGDAFARYTHTHTFTFTDTDTDTDTHIHTYNIYIQK